MELNEIIKQIEADPLNSNFTAKGWQPLLMVSATAKILIVGQAPGIKTQEKGSLFLDQSGDMLRDWFGVSKEVFYESKQFAVIPMDFYFPGKGQNGDLPPRIAMANKYHPLLLAAMPNIKLIFLVGTYAQKYYLGRKDLGNLTRNVQNYLTFYPPYFPLPHPSPRNFRWHLHNPWFKAEVVPQIKSEIRKIIGDRKSVV